MHAQIERGRVTFEIGKRAGEVMGERGAVQGRQRRERVAGRDRVGGIGLDQDGGPAAAQQLAREVLGHAEHELNVAARQELCRLRLARDLPGDGEIARVLERLHQAAGEHAAIGEQERGRQVLGIGVDRVAEQGQLEQRHRDQHGKGQPVAPHLDEFLDQDRPETAPGQARAVHDTGTSARWSVWMKTSSRLGRVSLQR
jgi:hypothetical protein